MFFSNGATISYGKVYIGSSLKDKFYNSLSFLLFFHLSSLLLFEVEQSVSLAHVSLA